MRDGESDRAKTEEEKVREWRTGDVGDQTKAHAYILTNMAR